MNREEALEVVKKTSSFVMAQAPDIAKEIILNGRMLFAFDAAKAFSGILIFCGCGVGMFKTWGYMATHFREIQKGETELWFLSGFLFMAFAVFGVIVYCSGVKEMRENFDSLFMPKIYFIRRAASYAKEILR